MKQNTENNKQETKAINPLVLKLQKLRRIKDTSKKIQEERIKNQNITNNN